MIKIDFHGSTHGHFLEYVTNVYIMQTAPSARSIFSPGTYSAHNVDDNYKSSRIIKCGHFSKQNAISSTDTVIRINDNFHNDDLFFIALTNRIYKTGDVGFETQMLSIPVEIRNNPVLYRNNWYSKINEKNLYADFYGKFLDVDGAMFEFPYSSFFDFKNFCTSLNRLAQFLNQTFFPDHSLYQMWKEFIELNQGWQSYKKCSKIIENIFANDSIEIDCTVIEQGWINYNIARTCRMYTGSMFDNEKYPSNTQHIYNEIQQHLLRLRYD